MNSLRLLKEVAKFRKWQSGLAFERCLSQKVQTENKSRTQGTEEEEVNNEPVPFFGSQAAMFQAKNTRSGGADESLWYQPYVISVSLAVFLLYFCVFREESDIDLKLEGNLYQHVKGLEEVQLTMTYKYNKENGTDNSEVIKRLKDLGIDVNLLDAKLAEGN